jgi:gas vesicle protein
MSYFAELVEKLSWDNENERRKAACRNLTTGLLIGAFVGVTAGILFAPKPGRETRKEIAEKAADAVDQLRETVAEFVSDLQERIEEAKSNEDEFEEIVDLATDNLTES